LSEKNSVGVAVRFRTLTNYRGCFALYCGIENLEGAIRHCAYEAAKDPRYPYIEKAELDGLYVNISIFSDWQKMSSALDFVPGFDSLIMDNPDAPTEDLKRTLLQASVATEHAYSQSDFLRRLCRKAQIAETAYKNAPQALAFYKSPTLTYTEKLFQQ
ncbi:MAG: AMMECR1 domain-containing protein, partial [Treponema sp.]|nr:AMMECR1 domain-containing protein [Treponema sp.]